MNKLKSSAVLIALFLGTILISVITLTALESQTVIGTIFNISDKVKASVAARSGIEAGQLKYKKFLEGSEENLYTELKDRQIYELPLDSEKSEKYSFSIYMEAISYGKDFARTDWLNNYKKAVEQEALPMQDKEDLMIDLEYLMNFALNDKRPSRIEVKFSNPFEPKHTEFVASTDSKSNVSLSAQLIDKVSGKEIFQSEVDSKKTNELTIQNLDKCILGSARCQLKLTLKSSRASEIAFLKIQAKSPEGLLKPTGDRPGTLIIHAEGTYGSAKVEKKAKYDKPGGDLLGIF